MITCDHDHDPATHYYRASGYRVHLCHYHADRFGYPQYLVPLATEPWRTRYGYVIQAHDGSGETNPVAEVWPFSEKDSEEWLMVLGCQDRYLLADAAWEPYRAHKSEHPAGLTFEATRVTCLPLV
ncbi:hypothetical protein ACFYWP_01655 [Actinacidiphila glaucinigra]|uniref:hypothetical protein n=1 Tax=Actinacidiphila glaucinigra TaxID=235986 RepID=UPI0036B7ECEB